MPLYSLRRMSDLERFEAGATDDQHAVAVFSALLKTPLTLEEGETVAGYMMRRIEEKEAHWAKAEDIPVWEA
jgi:hypothetical protein